MYTIFYTGIVALTAALVMDVKIKVKWSCYWLIVAQRVGRGIALLFHDRGTRSGWVVSSTPWPHFTPGKDTVPILQEAGWAPGPVWTGAENLVPIGIWSRTIQPVVSHYTDWATWPTVMDVYLYFYVFMWVWVAKPQWWVDPLPEQYCTISKITTETLENGTDMYWPVVPYREISKAWYSRFSVLNIPWQLMLKFSVPTLCDDYVLWVTTA